ncbi:MAG: MOSC domain-containing protein [Gammaproteobacteria bacterium]
MLIHPYLSEIYVYPVKSLSGIKVESWKVDEKGLEKDRKWMLVDRHGTFISQRQKPEMALISTALTTNSLILSAPGLSDLVIPIESPDGEEIHVSIWSDRCTARSVSKEADQWLQQFLHFDCSLVYQPDGAVRKVDARYASPDDQVRFSDGFPFLIVSENSLMALNSEMNQNLSIIRFRPNLVIRNCVPYAEDRWRNISIGAIRFRLPKPCSRCSVPAVDPKTARVDKEPLKTLNRLRKWKNKVYFGQNAIHSGIGLLSVGDQLVIHQTGPAQPPFLSPV